MTNDRLDRALDKLYDVLAKVPFGTSYQMRLKRARRRKIHNCAERGCAIKDHKFTSQVTGLGDKK
jgi:hypothetical protein